MLAELVPVSVLPAKKESEANRLPWLVLAIFLIALFIQPGCDYLSGKESDLSYEDASARIDDLSENSLRLGLGDSFDQASRFSREGFCANAFNAPSDFVHPAISYRFPLELLTIDPETFVVRVDDYWSRNKLETSSDDSGGVLTRFGVSDDGFNYQLSVNRESGTVYLGGSGPCVTPPESESE